MNRCGKNKRLECVLNVFIRVTELRLRVAQDPLNLAFHFLSPASDRFPGSLHSAAFRLVDAVLYQILAHCCFDFMVATIAARAGMTGGAQSNNAPDSRTCSMRERTYGGQKLGARQKPSTFDGHVPRKEPTIPTLPMPLGRSQSA